MRIFGTFPLIFAYLQVFIVHLPVSVDSSLHYSKNVLHFFVFSPCLHQADYTDFFFCQVINFHHHHHLFLDGFWFRSSSSKCMTRPARKECTSRERPKDVEAACIPDHFPSNDDLPELCRDNYSKHPSCCLAISGLFPFSYLMQGRKPLSNAKEEKLSQTHLSLLGLLHNN